MSDWTPAGNRGFAQGITHSSARIGNAIAPPLIAWLIVLFTWRGSFILTGALSFLWAIAWLWYFTDDPADHSGITEEEFAPVFPGTTRNRRRRCRWGGLRGACCL